MVGVKHFLVKNIKMASSSSLKFPRHLPNQSIRNVRRVLAIDGGGIRGIFPSTVLQKIVTYLKVTLTSQIELVVGNSIGGILALAIAQHVDTAPDVFLSTSNVNRIFNKSMWDAVLGIYQIHPKYDGTGKHEVLKQYFGDRLFGTCVIPTVLIAYNMETNQPRLFCSWDVDDAKLTCVDVAEATSAAPLYFPPALVQGQLYADGGLACNNPSLVAYTIATELWPQDNQFRILSIGNGNYKLKPVIHTNPQSWGLPKWLTSGNHRLKPVVNADLQAWGLPKWLTSGLFDILYNAPNQITEDLVSKLLPFPRFLRIDSDTIGSIVLDDTGVETRDTLKTEGAKVFLTHMDKLATFFT